MHLDEMVSFAAAAGLLLILPGPTNALLMAAGAVSGLRPSLRLIGFEILAYCLVIAPLVALQRVLGIYRIEAGIVLKLLAVGLLLVTALRMWKQPAPGPSVVVPQIGARTVFAITLFNPKGLIFAFAIFPPVLTFSDGLIKAALFSVLALVSGGSWILAGKTAGASLGASGQFIMVRGAAAVICLFAVYLTTSALLDMRALMIAGV